jgi:hypothetical protein
MARGRPTREKPARCHAPNSRHRPPYEKRSARALSDAREAEARVLAKETRWPRCEKPNARRFACPREAHFRRATTLLLGPIVRHSSAEAARTAVGPRPRPASPCPRPPPSQSQRAGRRHRADRHGDRRDSVGLPGWPKSRRTPRPCAHASSVRPASSPQSSDWITPGVARLAISSAVAICSSVSVLVRPRGAPFEE